MTRFKCVVFLMIVYSLSAFSQEHVVSIDNRNEAIRLTKLAAEQIKQTDYHNAINLLVKAISTDSIYHPSYLYLYQAAVKDTSSMDMTIGYLKKASEIFEEDDEIIFYLADLYRRKHDLKEAIVKYNEAIKYSKINGEDFYLVYSYYFNRGNCLMQIGSYDSALYDYNYTLKLKADYSYALINRGACYLYKEDIEDACQDWQRAYDLGNKKSLPYLNRYCKREP